MINGYYKRVEKDVFTYPDPTGVDGPCLRIKHPAYYEKIFEDIRGINKKLYHYTIAFAHEHHKIVNTVDFPDLQISHVCGNDRSKGMSTCCNINHLVIESESENKHRQDCHMCIRLFKAEYPNVSINGKITIEEINIRLNDANITDWEVSIPECNHLNGRECFIWYQ